ncbi:NAD-dependent epimerase/dehydratase family protein [Hymenobacter sp. DG01]|uniref:NAD-dependent epimerase/dehydratase family protein n=1 Tax=Hymenobacter sp. DG01 TaxID=2584940 RepID=UPI0011242BB2|nr:NAD-dependent epimerase/dehydratase family protein [Hymenobacter sp. DG01]
MKILVTGGAGFVGFNLLCYLKDSYPTYQLLAYDNLKRLGSEQNVPSLLARGIEFVHGDIRNAQELQQVGAVDVIIHCASDASVLGGITSSSELIVQNNLLGSINVFEYAAQCNAKLVYFSTNRIYSCESLNALAYMEQETRFTLEENQQLAGVSDQGISEQFPILLSKTFYGATKYCGEVLLQEYAAYKGLQYVVNRFGVISGKGQFGMESQGVIAYWLRQHLEKKPLKYIGFGGSGKQVRDALHVADVCALVDLQLQHFDSVQGNVFNAGGGYANSFSLLELTGYCEALTGNSVPIQVVADQRAGDIPIYYTDNSHVTAALGWVPQRSIHDILSDLLDWLDPTAKISFPG